MPEKTKPSHAPIEDSQRLIRCAKLWRVRWLRLLSVLGFVMAACGGSAAYDANGSRNVAGAAGKVGGGAGASSGTPPGVGGTSAGASPTSGAGIGADTAMGGASAGGLGEAGTVNAGATGEAAGVGGQLWADCQRLDCLAGAELVYWPDREWQGAKTNPASNELAEADYEPKVAPAWDVKFSSDARQVLLTPRSGGSPVQGVRDVQRTDRAWFDLMLAIGGRFVVQVAAPQFQAEYTAYGSGVPIVSSTRGALQAP